MDRPRAEPLHHKTQNPSHTHTQAQCLETMQDSRPECCDAIKAMVHNIVCTSPLENLSSANSNSHG
eukprot:4913295-Amphidinium_carterae.1